MSPEYTTAESPSLRLSINERLAAIKILLRAQRIEPESARELYADLDSDYDMLLQFTTVDEELYFEVRSTLEALNAIIERG